MITNDGNETADEAETLAATDNNREQRVPLAALALEGTAPGVGDAVEFTVGGKVARIEGDMAVVAIEALNGEPLPAAAPPGAEDDAMLAEAAAADAEAEKRGY
jgi:hypothetical protein